MFKLVNKNPKKRKAGDCAIRAICNAEDKNWLEVFDALVEIARRECFSPTDMNVINEYLKNYPTVSMMYDEHGKSCVNMRWEEISPGIFVFKRVRKI